MALGYRSNDFAGILALPLRSPSDTQVTPPVMEPPPFTFNISAFQSFLYEMTFGSHVLQLFLFHPTCGNMTSSTMSGTFTSNHTLPLKLDWNLGHFFQPPTTPSASSSLHLSTASRGPNESNSTSRKRSRHNSLQSHQSTPISSTGWSESTSGPPSVLLTPGLMSPTPLASSQYTLAGGLDTPTAAVASALERDDYGYGRYTPDASERRGRSWSNNADQSAGHAAFDGYFPPVLSTTSGVNRVRGSATSVQPANHGWGTAVFGAVGVAFKVLDFCKNSAFRGFFAGGGQGYQIGSASSPQVDEQSIWQDIEEKGDSHQLRQRMTTSIPGQFPEEDVVPQYMSQDHTSPSRPSKKVQREKGEGDIRSNWIMVACSPASRESSPSRVTARKVPSASASSPGRRSTVINARPALGKGARRPILPASRPSLSSHAGSPALRPNGPASYASTRSSPTTTPKYESPVTLEAQRYAAKARKREVEEEANLRRLNRQLKAMIREGKQALGTRVEIEDDVDELTDEGYAEGDLFDERAKG